MESRYGEELLLCLAADLHEAADNRSRPQGAGVHHRLEGAGHRWRALVATQRAIDLAQVYHARRTVRSVAVGVLHGPDLALLLHLVAPVGQSLRAKVAL